MSRNMIFTSLAVVGVAGLVAGCTPPGPVAAVTGARTYSSPSGGQPVIVVSYNISCPKGQLYELQVDLAEPGATGTSRAVLPVHGICGASVRQISDTVHPLTGTLHAGLAQVTTSFGSAPSHYPSLAGRSVRASVLVR